MTGQTGTETLPLTPDSATGSPRSAPQRRQRGRQLPTEQLGQETTKRSFCSLRPAVSSDNGTVCATEESPLAVTKGRHGWGIAHVPATDELAHWRARRVTIDKVVGAGTVHSGRGTWGKATGGSAAPREGEPRPAPPAEEVRSTRKPVPLGGA